MGRALVALAIVVLLTMGTTTPAQPMTPEDLADALAGAQRTTPSAEPERTYTVDELAARCQAAPAEVIDACLLVLYVFLVPEAGRTAPPIEPLDQDERHEFSGRADRQTPPFALSGGDYVVRYAASDTGSPDVGCYFSTRLAATDGSWVPGGWVNTIVEGSASDATYVYGLDPGRYYFSINTSCRWTVSIAPA